MENKRVLKRKNEEYEEKAEMPKMMGKRSPEMQRVDKMTGNLVEELMNAATSFHKLHLAVTKAGSFAQHKALNEIYAALPDLADTIAEGYQGACEVLLPYEGKGLVILNSVEDAIEYLRQVKMMIHELQEVMPHSEVVNNLDLVKDAINSAKYKLLFLS